MNSNTSSVVVAMTSCTEEQEGTKTREKILTNQAAEIRDDDHDDVEQENEAKHIFQYIEQLICESNMTENNDCNLTTVNNTKEEGLLRLPNGEEINAKNTLRSFDEDFTSPPSFAASRATASVSDYNNENILSRNLVANNNIDRAANATMINVQAMLVPAVGDVVDAQPVYSIIAIEADTSKDTDTGNITHPEKFQQSLQPWRKKRVHRLYLFIGISIVCVVVGIVLKTTSKQTSYVTTFVSSSPTASPADTVRTISPIFPLTDLSKAEGLTAYINKISLLGRNVSIDGITPEDFALRWLVNNDPLFNTSESWLPIISLIETNNNSTSGGSITTVEEFRLIQRYALLTLWFQQIDSSGSFQRTWTSIDGWTIDLNECNWFGVECTKLVFSNEIGVQDCITSTAFIGNKFSGTLSADLGLLQMLRHVAFSALNINTGAIENTITGTLPSTIGQWTALTYLDISYNIGLNGTLPSTIGQWTVLKHFRLSYTLGLHGTLPSSIGQWTLLTYFDVSSNGAITGTLPVTIGQWSSLTYFDVSFNLAISGTLPSSIGLWTELTHFNVHNMDGLRGSIPSTIIQWTALTYFDINYDFGLTGTLPSLIGQWTALIYFDVSYVYGLNGTLPSTIGLWTALTSFNVANNAFTGSIPSSVGNWGDPTTSISAIFRENQFTGTMPIEICYHNPTSLSADCKLEINCTCCTECF